MLSRACVFLSALGVMAVVNENAHGQFARHGFQHMVRPAPAMRGGAHVSRPASAGARAPGANGGLQSFSGGAGFPSSFPRPFDPDYLRDLYRRNLFNRFANPFYNANPYGFGSPSGNSGMGSSILYSYPIPSLPGFYGSDNTSSYGSGYSGLPGFGGNDSNEYGQNGNQRPRGKGAQAKQDEKRKDPAAEMEKTILAATGLPLEDGKLEWPLGLQILPGSAPLRQRIDALYTVASAQALTGSLNPKLPGQMTRAVRQFERFVARDKQQRLTLSSSMYAEGQGFLNRLEQSAQLFTALTFNRPSNPYAPATSASAPSPTLPPPTKKY